jgi:hypothetical protein
LRLPGGPKPILLGFGNLLAADLADFAVITGSDGSGRIVAYAAWPDDARAQLTSAFKTCVTELWECLDSLVIESVAMFSNLRRPKNPTAPRYFPIADSAQNFEALLAEACLDGVLKLQYNMVRDCQPFERDPDDERIERLRSGLRQLIDWSYRLEEGACVGAWATPADPQVHVEPPTQLVEVECQAPAELDDELVVARYLLAGYTSDVPAAGQAGTFIDLAFPEGFTPEDASDTFERRLASVIDTVRVIQRPVDRSAKR